MITKKMSEIDEPLALSAPVMHDAASRFCESCFDYHAMWQYLRLLGVITTVDTNTDFLTRCFKDLAKSGNYNRVLISGTADYGMLARLLWSYQQVGIIPQVTVVDICETPLFINRWYAERLGIEIETVKHSMLDYSNAGSFDLICTHSFLSQFTPDNRKVLLNNWNTLLRSGGKIITSQRVRPNLGRVNPEKNALIYKDKIYQAYQEFPGKLDIKPESLAQYATNFVLHKKRYWLKSQQELENLFTHAGFIIEEIHSGGEKEQAIDKPTDVMEKSERLGVIATKP